MVAESGTRATHKWEELSQWTIDEHGPIYVKRGEPADMKSARQVETTAIIDYNADGQLIGVEVVA